MFNRFYDHIEKFVPGNIYTIAARPGIGKTTVARHIANTSAKSGKKVLYIETMGITEKEISKRRNEKYDFLYRRLISAEEIRNIAFIGKYDLIVIDDFQDMYHGKKEDVAYKLKRLAEELNVAVIVLSNISRKADTRKDHHPLLSDLTAKMCGTLCKSSDVVILLWRDAYYERTCTNDELNFIIAKNVSGQFDRFELNFKKLREVWDGDVSE